MSETSLPLVTVICLCYKHADYVQQALESVFFQTYPRLQIIIVNDASPDQSQAAIERFLKDYPQYQLADQAPKEREVQFLNFSENQGHCRAFNQAFAQAKGKYIVDFATDDVMLDERLERQIQVFEQLPEKVGVLFGNCLKINKKGEVKGYHYPVDDTLKAKQAPPSGEVYTDLLARHFISAPSMTIRREVLEQLEGYDENLSYEDFDFWVRSARHYHYHYQDEALTMKRILSKSASQRFYQKKDNPHLASTLQVCHKAAKLNQNEKENEALAQRVAYHLQLAALTEHRQLAQAFAQLWTALKPQQSLPLKYRFLLKLAASPLPIYGIYRLWKRLRGG